MCHFVHQNHGRLFWIIIDDFIENTNKQQHTTQISRFIIIIISAERHTLLDTHLLQAPPDPCFSQQDSNRN